MERPSLGESSKVSKATQTFNPIDYGCNYYGNPEKREYVIKDIERLACGIPRVTQTVLGKGMIPLHRMAIYELMALKGSFQHYRHIEDRYNLGLIHMPKALSRAIRWMLFWSELRTARESSDFRAKFV